MFVERVPKKGCGKNTLFLTFDTESNKFLLYDLEIQKRSFKYNHFLALKVRYFCCIHCIIFAPI